MAVGREVNGKTPRGGRSGSPRGRIAAMAALTVLGSTGSILASASPPPETGGPQEIGEPDLLTLARGAVPLSMAGAGAGQGADLSHALRFVDGDPRGFSFVNRATDATDTEIVYRLPSATVFHRLAVPDVLETPSPFQTFVRRVEVHGSAEGPQGPWTLLGSGELESHSARGQLTELEMHQEVPVRWVRLRLVGGIEMLRDAMFLEFGEIIGNGEQVAPALAETFQGSWWDRGVRLTLLQDGPVVTGCYDDGSTLEGTVTGNLLEATGVGRSDGVVSHFLLGVTDEGEIRGVRSTNGAPFALYSGAVATGRKVECAAPREPPLGCGSVIHGIRFDFDSDVLRPESGPVLAKLAEGLVGAEGSITIEGHTSSEGSDAYNLDLSRRRAEAVVAQLASRGLDAGRMDAAGRGESVPVASNDDENGRAMNRRVEVRCSGPGGEG